MYWFIKSIKLTCFLPQNFFKQEIPHLKLNGVVLFFTKKLTVV